MRRRKEIESGIASYLAPRIELISRADRSKRLVGTGRVGLHEGKWFVELTHQSDHVTSLKNIFTYLNNQETDVDDRLDVVGELWDGEPFICEAVYTSTTYHSSGARFDRISPRYVVLGYDKEDWCQGDCIVVTYKDTSGWSDAVRIEKDKMGFDKYEPLWWRHRFGKYLIKTIPYNETVSLYLRHVDGVPFGKDAIRAVEFALSYVSGELNGPKSFYISEKDRKSEVYFGVQGDLKPAPYLPLQARRHQSHKADAMRLMSIVLVYALGNPNEAAMLEAHVDRVYRAMRNSVASTLLAITTAIEFIVDLWFPDRGPTAEDRELQERLKLALNWDLVGEGYREKLGDRYGYWVSNIGRESVYGRLKILASIGVVPSDGAKVWKRCRNQVAHGKPMSSDIDSVSDMLSLAELMHRMIAWRVGYAGNIAGYSAHGYGSIHFIPPKYSIHSPHPAPS